MLYGCWAHARRYFSRRKTTLPRTGRACSARSGALICGGEAAAAKPCFGIAAISRASDPRGTHIAGTENMARSASRTAEKSVIGYVGTPTMASSRSTTISLRISSVPLPWVTRITYAQDRMPGPRIWQCSTRLWVRASCSAGRQSAGMAHRFAETYPNPPQRNGAPNCSPTIGRGYVKPRLHRR